MRNYLKKITLKKRVTHSKLIILVTGTPGIGKTEVSRTLASMLNAKHIDLGELVKHENLISGVDEVRRTLIVDINKVSKRLDNIIKETNQDVVIDGHYAVDVVPPKEVELVLVLRRDPDELQGLMENKGFRERELYENLAAEILDVCLWNAVKVCGLNKVCEIDASGKGVREVAEHTISVLSGERQRQVGIVDWLGKLDKEGRLQHFFKNL